MFGIFLEHPNAINSILSWKEMNKNNTQPHTHIHNMLNLSKWKCTPYAPAFKSNDNILKWRLTQNEKKKKKLRSKEKHREKLVATLNKEIKTDNIQYSIQNSTPQRKQSNL